MYAVTADNQRITEFYPILDQLKVLIESNKHLSETLSYFIQKKNQVSSDDGSFQSSQDNEENDFLCEKK